MTIRTVTPEMAARWLETMPYEHQRGIRQNWADFLAEEIRRGNFQQNTVIKIACLDGRQILVDGQHRLWAVVNAGVAQSFVVHTSLADDSDQVAWMYANTDIGLRRTASDLYAALDLPTELGMTKSQIDALSATIGFMLSGMMRQDNSGVRKHRDTVLAGIRLYAPYARQFFALMEKTILQRNGIRRAATVGVAVLTLRFSVPKARQSNMPSPIDFWQGVAADDELRATDPRKFATRHLLTSGMVNGRRAGAKIVTPQYSARMLASCFNAYVARREISQTPKVLDPSAPIVIYGVPREPAQWFAS